MARAPRQNTAKAAEAPKTAEFYILDPNASEIAGKRIPVNEKTGKRDATIRLTDTEAAFFLASGAISARNPAEDKKAAEVVTAAAKK